MYQVFNNFNDKKKYFENIGEAEEYIYQKQDKEKFKEVNFYINELEVKETTAYTWY